MVKYSTKRNPKTLTQLKSWWLEVATLLSLLLYLGRSVLPEDFAIILVLLPATLAFFVVNQVICTTGYNKYVYIVKSLVFGLSMSVCGSKGIPNSNEINGGLVSGVVLWAVACALRESSKKSREKETDDVISPSKMIAMEGHPCTGKSRLAKALAETLRCPIISQDDVRDAYNHPPPQSTITEACKDDIHVNSFDTVCRIASRQCVLRVPYLIVDSSLSCRADLDKLLAVSVSTGASLVVVECKPGDKYEWQQWAENRGDYPWYKPSKWDDIEEQLLLLQRTNDDDVSKVVVDTTTPTDIKSLRDLVDQLGAAFPTIICTDYISPISLLHKHAMRFMPEHQLKKERLCSGCQQTVAPNSLAYGCRECDLTVHNSCAELPHRKEINPRDYPNFQFLLDIQNDQYSFQEPAMCNNCETNYLMTKDEDCHRCLHESYIRSAELPSVIQHPCHEHLLQVLIHPISYHTVFKCEACGYPGKHIRYTCYECRFDYHLTCCLLPHTGKETHHLHNLTITNFVKDYESDDEFICNACETYRNPKCWIYHCRVGCLFSCHLKCMTFDV